MSSYIEWMLVQFPGFWAIILTYNKLSHHMERNVINFLGTELWQTSLWTESYLETVSSVHPKYNLNVNVVATLLPSSQRLFTTCCCDGHYWDCAKMMERESNRMDWWITNKTRREILSLSLAIMHKASELINVVHGRCAWSACDNR